MNNIDIKGAFQKVEEIFRKALRIRVLDDEVFDMCKILHKLEAMDIEVPRKLDRLWERITILQQEQLHGVRR